MTYPQQPGYPPAQPGYPPAEPQYQQPGYPAQAPGYPPQQPQYQGYPPQQPQYGPPQGPPAPALPKTGLADFMDQPAMSGGALSFPAPGTRHTVVVSRDLTDADFPVQTDPQGQPKRFRDGRLMVVMVVPCRIRPDAEHPDGHASWWVKGQAAEALKRAMSLAGAGDRNGIPERDALIGVLHTMVKPSKRGGQNPTKIYEVTYQRPAGAGNGQAAAQQTPAQQAYGGPGPGAMVQGPGGGTVPAGPGGQPQPTAQYAPNGQQAQAPYIPQAVQAMVPQGPQAPANFANPQGSYAVPQQPQWPAPGAPLSAPPQPAPPGENPYNNPALPPNQAAPSIVGAQVAAATQAGLNAAAAAAPPPPELTPDNAALIASLTGGQPPQQ